MFKKLITVSGIIGGVVLIATGCSTVSTESDEVVLHYEGGSMSSSKFSDCVPSSQRDWNGPGDKYYAYPAGQRTFSFTGAQGSETPALAVTTKDSQSIQIPGFVTFELNTNCEDLRKFHEAIGRKYEAYKKDGQTSPGWNAFLLDYLAVPLTSTMNNAAGNVATWQTIYNSDAERSKLEAVVKTNLPAALKKTLGADYIKVVEVSFGKPTADPQLLAQVTEKEKNRLAKEAQLEKNNTQSTKYDGFATCRTKGLSEQACLLIYMADSGKIPFYPVPAGGGINVQPK